LSEITPKSRYQAEIFSSLDDQVEQSSIARIIDKVVDKIYQSEQASNEKDNEVSVVDRQVGRPEFKVTEDGIIMQQ